MKKIVIAVAVMLMIAGATVSVLKWLSIGPFAEEEAEAVAVETEATGPSGEPLHFVAMDVLVIPIYQGENAVATVQIQLKLEAADVEKGSEIAHMLPRLHDAFLRDLYGFIPRHLRKEERVNVALIKERLQMVGDKVAGPGVIKNILVQALLEQPSR